MSSHNPINSQLVTKAVTRGPVRAHSDRHVHFHGQTSCHGIEAHMMFMSFTRRETFPSVADPAGKGYCLRDQNFIYFSQYKLKDIQKQSQLKNTIASPKIQRHQPKHKNNMDTTQNNVHVQRYDRVLTTEY